jgi:hypothetical protein
LILVLVAVGAFASMHISVGESAQGIVVAEVQIGEEAWADSTPPAASPVTQADKDDVWKSFLSLLNGITNIFFALLTPLLMLAGWLLTPDWVFGEIFGLRPILHNLWILVSNVVYVIFAFLLVVMAFMNIFAGEKNTWAIKAKLPKLIVGVISVPFTWFFVSAVISISSVLTASAIQLAGDLVPTDAQATFMAPKECTINFKATPKWTGTGLGVDSDGSFSSCTKSEPRKLSDFLKSKDAYGIVSYYAYWVFQVQDLKKITGPNLETAKTLLDLWVGVLMALIIFIIFLLIIIALVIAMMMRAFYFWAIAIFSPLLSLRYFFDGKLWFGDDWLSVGSIIGLAMVPVYVAAALSLGLVFISAASSTDLTVKKSDYVTEVSMTPEKQEITVLGTKFTVLGTPVWANTAADIKTLGGGFIGGLLIKIAALCILWFAVMSALKGSKITQEAAEPISKFGGEIWSLLKKLPQYAPVIPTGHGKASLSSLWNISSRVSGDIQSRQNQVGQDIGSSISRAMGVAGKETVTAIQRAGATPPTDVSQAAGVVTNMMKAADAADRAQFISPAKRQEREAMAKVIENNFAKVISSETDRKKIADGLRSQSDQLIEQALRDLEHNLSGSSLWGSAGIDLLTKDGQDKWIKGLKVWADASNWTTIKPVSNTINSIAGTNINLDVKVTDNWNKVAFTNQWDLKKALADAQSSMTAPQKTDYKNGRAKDIRDALTAKNIDKATIDALISELYLI